MFDLFKKKEIELTDFEKFKRDNIKIKYSGRDLGYNIYISEVKVDNIIYEVAYWPSMFGYIIKRNKKESIRFLEGYDFSIEMLYKASLDKDFRKDFLELAKPMDLSKY